MRYLKKVLLTIAFSLLCFNTVLANSAAPPALIVRVRNAPPGVSVSIDTHLNGRTKGKHKLFNGKSYFVFGHENGSFDNSPLYVDFGAFSFAVDFPPRMQNKYEEYYTLDFPKRSLSVGERDLRSDVFIALRVIATLIIEGLIFKWMGFKEKRSWCVFLITNLLTQTALNIAVFNTINPFFSYSYLALTLYEFLVIITEMFIYILFIEEERPVVVYAITANLLSWHLGGWVLAMLPI